MEKLSDLVKSSSSFLLISHEDPDGDSIGSALALGEFLKSKGKNYHIVIEGNIPEVFNYLEKIEQISGDFLLGDYEVIILLDCGDIKRTAFVDRIKTAVSKKIPIVNIDHHQKNDIWKIADINLADPEASSTCQIIYNFFEFEKYQLTPSVSTSLLTGIYGDTGGFQHPNTTGQVLSIASELLKKGAKLRKISKNISQSRSAAMLKLWGVALERMKIDKLLKVVISVITKVDLVEVGAKEEEIAGLINLLNNLPDARAVILLYETDNGKIRGSLRTEDNTVDVSVLASYFGGGGHKRAAGFCLKGAIVKKPKGWQVV